MVDWYMLVVSFVVLAILIIGNIYYLAHFAHPNDTPFGKSLPMRALVV
jgi:hypothetical protein